MTNENIINIITAILTLVSALFGAYKFLIQPLLYQVEELRKTIESTTKKLNDIDKTLSLQNLQIINLKNDFIEHVQSSKRKFTDIFSILNKSNLK